MRFKKDDILVCEGVHGTKFLSILIKGVESIYDDHPYYLVEMITKNGMYLSGNTGTMDCKVVDRHYRLIEQKELKLLKVFHEF